MRRFLAKYRQNQIVRRRKGKRYCLRRAVKHYFYVEGIVNASEYKEIILEGVKPTMERLTSEVSHPLFQDDYDLAIEQSWLINNALKINCMTL